MKKIVVGLLMILPILALAQDEKNNETIPFIKRTSIEAGLTLGGNGDLYSVALNGTQYWGLGRKNRKFKLGGGLKFNSYFGNDALEYITAPAKLTGDEANLDTVRFAATQVNTLNLFLALRYDVTERWGAEFNIDLAGFSFGAEQDGNLTFKDGNVYATKGTPSAGNVLLVGDNDIGNLNSELMITYRYKSNWRFKAGALYQFTEYSLDPVIKYTNSQGDVLETQRYRAKNISFGAGVNYVF